jgi:hypothetical protein
MRAAVNTKTAGGSRRGGRPPRMRGFLWDLLTFERLMTGPITHLIYWAGLAIIVIIGFGVVGGAIGLLIRDLSLEGVALAVSTLAVGLLITAALIMVWRGMCEFYLAVFQIAEDLRALRIASEAEPTPETPPRPTPPDVF